MKGSARFNANAAPFLVPLLALGALPMSGLEEEAFSSGAFAGVAGGWLVLLGLGFYWRARSRAVGGGRAALGIALWVLSGLSVMLALYNMLRGLDLGTGVFGRPMDVATRSFQALVFYAAAVVVSCRSVRVGAPPPTPET